MAPLVPDAARVAAKAVAEWFSENIQKYQENDGSGGNVTRMVRFAVQDDDIAETLDTELSKRFSSSAL